MSDRSAKFLTLTQTDHDRVAQLQIASWRATYDGVLPAAYVAGGMVRDIRARWSVPTGHQTPPVLLCGAQDPDGVILGFAAVILGSTPYLDNFHVAEAAQGRRVAHGLMAYVADRLIATGERALSLTVLDTNARARAFYRKLGGMEGAAGPDDIYGHPVTSIPVRWDNLAELSKIARQHV